ncbi:MAG: PTS sugar transporter subunit IIB [Erysipelotrichaceae bacterium]|nr:PTS sugar transporter subunit IIB [Erysipelotrichaceae bacterium]
MKILLCCKAGVTSNMFAAALKDEAEKKGIEDVIVWAAAETAVEYSAQTADIILVTPQLRSSLTKFEDLANPGTPVILISDDDFVQFNAKKVLDEALAQYNA